MSDEFDDLIGTEQPPEFQVGDRVRFRDNNSMSMLGGVWKIDEGPRAICDGIYFKLIKNEYAPGQQAVWAQAKILEHYQPKSSLDD